MYTWVAYLKVHKEGGEQSQCNVNIVLGCQRMRIISTYAKE